MIKIHIEIGQFQFIEKECETLEEAKDAYLETKALFNSSTEGLDDKSWRTALDRYLTEGDMDSNDYSEMSDKQKTIIQEVKKSINRVNGSKQ